MRFLQSHWLALIFGGLAVGAGIAAGMVAQYVPNFMVIVLLLIGSYAMFASVKNSEFGLIMMIFILYVRLSDVLVHFHGIPSIAKPLIPFMVLTILIRWLLYSERPTGWLRPALVMAGFGLAAFPSLIYATDFYRVRYALSDYVKDALIVIVIGVLLQRGYTLRKVIWALLAAGIIMGSITSYQYLTATFDNPYWGYGQAEIENITTGSDDYRISGPLENANAYGQIMVVLVPLALERVWNEKKLIWRIIAGWALVACVLAVLFTFSRGSFLAMMVALVFMLVRRPPSPVSLLITIIVASQLMQFAPAGYTERILTLTEIFSGDVRNEVSFRGRASENKSAIMMFHDNPLLGVGLENFPIHYQDYSRQLGLDMRRGERGAHSLYLQIISEQGLLGIIALVGLLWTVFGGLSRAEHMLKNIGQFEYADMVSAIMAAVVAYFVVAIWKHNSYARFLWITVGIALATYTVARNEVANYRNTALQSENHKRPGPARVKTIETEQVPSESSVG